MKLMKMKMMICLMLLSINKMKLNYSTFIRRPLPTPARGGEITLKGAGRML